MLRHMLAFMADDTGEHEDQDADWHTDLRDNVGAARLLDQDLRETLSAYLQPRAERQRLEALAGDRQPPLREPTVDDVALDATVVLRGSDVRVTWGGLRPRGARVTVIGPDRAEQVVSGGSSATVRATRSGPVTLRLRNEVAGRFAIADVHVGTIRVFELPPIRIPSGILPPIPPAQLPAIRIPQHVSAALTVPAPRLRSETLAQLLRAVRTNAPRAVGMASIVAGAFARAVRQADVPTVPPGVACDRSATASEDIDSQDRLRHQSRRPIRKSPQSQPER